MLDLALTRIKTSGIDRLFHFVQQSLLHGPTASDHRIRQGGGERKFCAGGRTPGCLRIFGFATSLRPRGASRRTLAESHHPPPVADGERTGVLRAFPPAIGGSRGSGGIGECWNRPAPRHTTTHLRDHV